MNPLKKLPKNPQKYGPGVLNREDYEAMQEVVSEGKNKYGPALLGKSPEAREAAEAPRAPKAPAPPPTLDKEALDELVAKYSSEDGYVSIKDLTEILDEMPSAFDRLFGWELNRKDGPRIGALQELQRREVQREPPRGPVLQAIETAIAKARGDLKGKED